MARARIVSLFCLLLASLFLRPAPAQGAGPRPGLRAQTSDASACVPRPEDMFSREEMAQWSAHRRQKRLFHYFRAASGLAFYLLFFALGLNGRLQCAAERGAAFLYGRPGLVRLGHRWSWLPRLRKVPETLFSGRQWLVVLLYAIGFVLLVRLLFLPYTFYRTYWFEKAIGLSNYTAGLWFLDYAKSLVLGTLPYALMVFGIYGLMGRVGRRWWLWLWGGVSLAILAWVYVVPYRQMAFHDFRPLEPGEVRTRLEALAREQDLSLEDIYVVDASRRTNTVNAYVTGRGATRRIVLYDNLLKNFTPEEIAMIMAHEFVHWKEPDKKSEFLVFSATVFGILFLADRILVWGSRVRFFRFRGVADVAGLPLLLLTFSLLFMLIRPVNLYVRRHHELETDRKSLAMLCAPEAFVSAHVKLARFNNAEIEPHPFVVAMFYSHPPFLQRVALGTCESCPGQRAVPGGTP